MTEISRCEHREDNAWTLIIVASGGAIGHLEKTGEYLEIEVP
jgi:hypothetical protein